MLSLNNPFPQYELKSVHNAEPTSDFPTQTGEELLGKWRIYLFWPKDFTFVCPTEIVGFGEIVDELKSRNTELIGVSTDSEFTHLAWRQHNPQLTHSPFPWLSDICKDLSRSVGVLDETNGVAHRATLIVDPDGLIQSIQVVNDRVGRNPEETLRELDALQSNELCPCRWQPGDAVLS